MLTFLDIIQPCLCLGDEQSFYHLPKEAAFDEHLLQAIADVVKKGLPVEIRNWQHVENEKGAAAYDVQTALKPYLPGISPVYGEEDDEDWRYNWPEAPNDGTGYTRFTIDLTAIPFGYVPSEQTVVLGTKDVAIRTLVLLGTFMDFSRLTLPNILPEKLPGLLKTYTVCLPLFPNPPSLR